MMLLKPQPSHFLHPNFLLSNDPPPPTPTSPSMPIERPPTPTTPPLISPFPPPSSPGFPHDDDMFQVTVNAFNEGRLRLFKEGMGGTYLIYSLGSNPPRGPVAVFKPACEEAGCMDNPKGNFQMMRKGIGPGEGFIREIAAFMLDYGRVAGVPFTQIVEMDVNGKKYGSLQRYVDNVCCMTDMSPSLFTVENVQWIAQLDIRLFNVDRNDENLLVVKNEDSWKMIPIDHAYTLPNTLEDGAWFDWLNWKQVKQPMSKELLEYIGKIDIERDVEVLRKLKIGRKSQGVLRMATMTLKVGAEYGLNLFEIALFITRRNKNEESLLEQVEKEAKKDKNVKFWVNFTKLLNERMRKKDWI